MNGSTSYNRLSSSVATLKVVADAARSAGLGKVRSHLSISPGLADRSRISHDLMTGLFMRLEASSGDETLGIRLAKQAPLRAFNVAVYAFLSSATLGIGLEQMARFQSIHTLASRMQIHHQGELVAIEIDLADGALQTTRAQREYYLALLWRYMLWQMGSAATPVRIKLRGVAHNAARYEAFFGCPVLFGQTEDAILISRRLWEQRSIHACPEVFHAMRQLAELQLKALEANQIEAQVRLALSDLMEEATVLDLISVARRLNMSARTIQRRLASEGTNFQKVIDKHLEEHARQLLARTAIPIAEIADACGFAARRSFHRAFQRWTGLTPTQFRRRGIAAVH